jgi:hypothetical protein
LAHPEFKAVKADSLIVKVVLEAGLPTIRVSAVAIKDPDNKISKIESQRWANEVKSGISFRLTVAHVKDPFVTHGLHRRSEVRHVHLRYCKQSAYPRTLIASHESPRVTLKSRCKLQMCKELQTVPGFFPQKSGDL